MFIMTKEVHLKMFYNKILVPKLITIKVNSFSFQKVGYFMVVRNPIHYMCTVLTVNTIINVRSSPSKSDEKKSKKD